MSANVVATDLPGDSPEAPHSVSLAPRTVAPVVAWMAPLVAAGAALLIQRLLPIQQEHGKGWMDALRDWQHPYPVLLAGFMATWLMVVGIQWVWRPLARWANSYGPLMAGAVVVVTLWDLLTAKMAWLPYPYFPSPDEVLGGMIEDRQMLLVSTYHSLRLLAIGYASGVSAGLVTGVLIGWFTRARYWGMPVMKFLGPLPATALVPLVMILPTGDYYFLSGAALIAFASWFPVTMLTFSGIANVRISYLDVARTLGAGRLYLIFRVAIPSALPNIFVGLFQALGTSFLTLIAAETIGVRAGLGWYIGFRKSSAEYTKVYAALFIMAMFCSCLMTLLFKVRDAMLKWQKGVIKW